MCDMYNYVFTSSSIQNHTNYAWRPIYSAVKSVVFAIGKLQPPVIPFMPLLLKGLFVCVCTSDLLCDYMLWLFRYHIYKWRKWNLHRWFSEFWKNGRYFVTVCEYIANSSAGTNVYFPHSKVLLLKRTNVRMFVLFSFYIRRFYC